MKARRPTANKKKLVNLRLFAPLIIIVIIGVVGAYVMNQSDAARRVVPGTGTIQVVDALDLNQPFSVQWSYSKSAKQLERPFIEYACYRDLNGDGTIDSSVTSPNRELVYAMHTYVLDTPAHPDYPVTINSGTSGLSGVASANLLSGSSQLVGEQGPALCSASLQEWDANVRQQTSPIIYATTDPIMLVDPRQDTPASE